jgi:hypothetical protein
MQNDTLEKRRRLLRRAAWIWLFLLVVAAFLVVGIPVWIVYPFRAETPEGLQFAYTLKHWSPLVTLLFAVMTLATIVWLWRGARRWWRKGVLLVLLLLILVPAWFARQNHFEWMFNPITSIDYAPVSEASFMDDDDKVLAIEINGDAAAYPIRQMAYHHLVNDVVGGMPITATY